MGLRTLSRGKLLLHAVLALVLISASVLVGLQRSEGAVAVVAVDTRVAAGPDDAEESSTGAMYLTSSDLELTVDPRRGAEQVVGIRFDGVAVPPDARIINAHIQFQADETHTDTASLRIEAEAGDDPPGFSSTQFDISSRVRTAASREWVPLPWTSGDAGPDQRTPALTALVQELVDRTGWASGNAMVFIITGSGQREAEAYDGLPGAAPLLHIEYLVPVSVDAIDEVAVEGAVPTDGALFRFTRAGPIDVAIEVSFGVGGTATPDDDYSALAGTVTIPSGSQHADVVVTPIDDPDIEHDETVIVTVVDGPDYVPGRSPSATATLLDDDLTTVSVIATDGIATEGDDPPNTGEFTFTRSGPLHGSLTVDYTVGGTATATADYAAFPGSIIIAAGANAATLSLTAFDDIGSEPPESVSVTVVSGPGYLPDGAHSAEATIVDNDPVVEIRPVADGDDVEEDVTGIVTLASSDLELVYDSYASRGDQVVGIRYAALDVPAGAIVTSAWLQFQVDEVSDDAASLTIEGEAADYSAPFAPTPFNVSSRTRTANSVPWSPPPWNVVAAAGWDQRTPDLTAVVQQIIDRPGWSAGNAVAFIISGSGKRVAESYNGEPLAAPLLHVEHSGVGPPDDVPPPPPGSGLGEGSVGLLVHARSAFDPWTDSPSVAEQQTMRDLYDRMVVYSPYFDSRLAWYPNGLAYIDAYAIYTNTNRDDRSITNPEWILRDAAGNRLYIPYACSGGTCPQWAGDFGNPAFRADFLNRIQALIDRGYRGIALDDVNLEWRTSDGFGNRVIPIDPRTGVAMTLQDWRRYFAEFMELIRTTHPDIEIMHNALWFADSPYFDDPYVTRQIAAADMIMLERGANDRGLVGGVGRKFGFDTFLGYIERVHTASTDVLLLDEGKQPGSSAAQEYNLAAYFLISSGGDLVSTEDYPMIGHDSPWPGFTADLGDALGPRTRTDGLHRRDFTGGIVLLNEPGASPTTINLPTTYTDLTGNPVTTLTLQPETAAILLNP